MKIGNVNFEGKVALAPMAGVADKAFREICASFGAGYVVGEMISATGLVYNDKKTIKLMEIGKNEGISAIQLFGNDRKIMAEATKKALLMNPNIIDINMGCPAPKIVNQGYGSALMKNPELCGELVETVKKESSVPVTVKIRKGWDENSANAVEVAKICEQAGADAITIHGRTREQMYAPSADWEIIRQVKQAVKIPVIGNGDVISGESAALMFEETGCDMVMVGRGALGNPWIFPQINNWLSDMRQMPLPGLNERMFIMSKHIYLLCEYKGEYVGMREARKHLGWYMHGLKSAAKLRKEAGKLELLEQLPQFVELVFEENT